MRAGYIGLQPLVHTVAGRASARFISLALTRYLLAHSLTELTRYVLRDKESTVRVDLSQLRHDHYSATSHPLGHYPHPMPHPGTPGAGPLTGAPMGGAMAVGVGPMGHATIPMARPRPASEAGDWVSCGNWAGDGAVPRCAGGSRCAGAELNPSRLTAMRAPSFRAQVCHRPCARSKPPPILPPPCPLALALPLALPLSSP